MDTAETLERLAEAYRLGFADGVRASGKAHADELLEAHDIIERMKQELRIYRAED